MTEDKPYGVVLVARDREVTLHYRTRAAANRVRRAMRRWLDDGGKDDVDTLQELAAFAAVRCGRWSAGVVAEFRSGREGRSE